MRRVSSRVERRAIILRWWTRAGGGNYQYCCQSRTKLLVVQAHLRQGNRGGCLPVPT